jgi:SpoVK/Ycf46/Vps4 family AAA+-type ATPase
MEMSNSFVVSNEILNINFNDIIGHNRAKQSICENVILPLLLANEIRQNVFKGVRGGVGNVLLFGPPGILSKLFYQLPDLLCCRNRYCPFTST